MTGKKNDTLQNNTYRTVDISGLGNRRRGKHHDLIRGILRELKALKTGSALVVPLSQVDGVELANLRSAVHRAAMADSLTIETQSDEQNFYVWLTEETTVA